MSAKLYVMCGLQGSGKSTIAKTICCGDDILKRRVILSSDELRKEFPSSNNSTIFEILYKRMNEELADGKTVIVDATNITIKSRKQLLSSVKQECFKICYIVNTPYEICLERVRNRNTKTDSHYVPEEVLNRYYHSFEIPFYEEGWDNIRVHKNIPKGVSINYLNKLTTMAESFNQNNKHHSQLLGEHMKTVADNLGSINAGEILIEAGKYHDIGKLFTQTYKEGDPNAHYYDHANIGTYNLLCHTGMFSEYFTNDYSVTKTLDWLFYINYHMKMHNIKTDKSIKKWKSIFGEKRFMNLVLFNKSDCFRGSVDEFKKSLINSVDTNESSTTNDTADVVDWYEEMAKKYHFYNGLGVSIIDATKPLYYVMDDIKITED